MVPKPGQILIPPEKKPAPPPLPPWPDPPDDLSARSKELWANLLDASRWRKDSLNADERTRLMTECLRSYDQSNLLTGAERERALTQFLTLQVSLGLLAERR